jgi:hypothetical protein
MKTTRENNPDIRILKTGECLSRSGKSKLTYHIGCTPESEILFRIHANTGNGFFSNEWLPLKTILEQLSKGSFTSFSLYPLFHGKSNNTPAFLLAVLLEEGLVTVNGRSYGLTDPKEIQDRIALLAGTTEHKPQKAAKKKLDQDPTQ